VDKPTCIHCHKPLAPRINWESQGAINPRGVLAEKRGGRPATGYSRVRVLTGKGRRVYGALDGGLFCAQTCATRWAHKVAQQMGHKPAGEDVTGIPNARGKYQGYHYTREEYAQAMELANAGEDLPF
jgi:hypothetical protein